jgi:hypothetical protein
MKPGQTRRPVMASVAVQAEPAQGQDPDARGPLVQGADHVTSWPAQQHPRFADIDRDNLKARHTTMLPRSHTTPQLIYPRAPQRRPTAAGTLYAATGALSAERRARVLAGAVWAAEAGLARLCEPRTAELPA